MGFAILLHEGGQHQHGHESVVSVVQYFPSSEQTDVQSVQNDNSCDQQEDQSPQCQQPAHDQMDLQSRRGMHSADQSGKDRTIERTRMKKLNQRGCRMRLPSGETSDCVRECLITMSATRTKTNART